MQHAEQAEVAEQLASEDEFDDFNEPVAANEEDDEFGSFDNDSFDDFEQPQSQFTDSYIVFDSGNIEKTEAQIEEFLDELFPINDTEVDIVQEKTETDALLNERSSAIYSQLSKVPYLKPSNWTRLQIRHNLLIKLGIPIDLDEIRTEKPSHLDPAALKTKAHNRRKSINEDDIDWNGILVPEFESLNLTEDNVNELMNRTDEILSKVETDNLNNSSKSYLDAADEGKLLQKLEQFKKNHEEMTKLASVWNHHFKDLKSNFEIYENVVQNLIGYSQKLERDELLQNLKQVKSKSKRKKNVWR